MSCYMLPLNAVANLLVVKFKKEPPNWGENFLKSLSIGPGLGIANNRAFNKNCGEITLFHADFLESSQVDDVLRRADVVFVNNYIFDAELNQAILDKFLDLKDGAKVISLKSFAPKIGGRNSGSIGAIFADSQEYFFGRDRVSWTSEGGSFFVQTVDRTGLRKVGI